MRRICRQLNTNQTGAAMALVLIFMTVAVLVVPPTLSYLSTGFKTGLTYEENTRQLYAAESGVNDGLWYARYDNFTSLFGESYLEYDFQTTWDYDISELINGYNVNVEIENVWLPSSIAAPTEIQARTIIENGQLILSGSAPPESTTYRVRLSFYPDAGNDPKIESLGIWLPPGFSYVEGSCNLENDPMASYYPVDINISTHASGQAVVWDFWSVPIVDFGPLVDTDGASITSTITFEYTSEEADQRPGAVSWVTTSDAPDVPFTWDADTKIYHITATAGDASVEAYVGKSEIRDLDSAVNGDYLAVGNTLMTATGDPAFRDRLYKESSAVVAEGDLPGTTTIQSARLYWSGWIDEAHETEIFHDSVSSDGQWEQVWQDDCSTLRDLVSAWHDDCSSMSGWNAGADWDVDDHRFRGYHQGDEDDRYLTLDQDIDLGAYQGTEVTLSWEQAEFGNIEPDDALRFAVSADGGDSWSGTMLAFNNDNPSSPFSYTLPDEYLTSQFRIRFYLDGFSNPNEYAFIDDIDISATQQGRWDAGADWSVYYDQFVGHHSGTEEDRYLTLRENIDLSGYTDRDMQITWEQDEYGDLESEDSLRFAVSADGGWSWSDMEAAFNNDNPSSPFSYDIPAAYLTDEFRVQFYLDDFSGGEEYAFIDTITVRAAIPGGWVQGDDWDTYNNEFRGHHDAENDEADRYLTMGSSVDLSAFQGTDVQISWSQHEYGYLESDDGLKFSFSGNDGITWGSPVTAFTDDYPVQEFSYSIPAGFLTDEFRVRFYLEGTGGDSEYVYIDDIRISQVDFGVGTVVFNGHEITADRQQFEENGGYYGSNTYSYSCYYDATDLINQMIADEDLGANGSGTYTLGHVLRLRDGDPYSVSLYPSGETGYPLGIPDTDTGYGEYAYAGWSLILIYTSPEVDGHQMYLYDDFSFVGSGDTVSLPISGFLTPPNPEGSRLTCFVGEGDPFYTGDYVRLNDQLLSDDVNPADNFFNSYSNALDNPNLNGIDLDTFDISGYVQAGDTSADFETGTPLDIYNIVYIILSFRHDTTFSGTVSYLIRN